MSKSSNKDTQPNKESASSVAFDEKDPPVIKVNKIKMKAMLEMVWTDLETPLFAVQTDFRKSTERKSRSGFAILTYGALYLFKEKLIQNPKLKFMISLLDYIEICLNDDNSIELKNEKHTIRLSKHQHNAPMFEKMAQIIFTVTYGVTDIILPKFVPKPQTSPYKSRPPGALVKRCLFFAHFYNKPGNILIESKYFSKHDIKPTEDFLTIGPHFHPGNFALAYGHAIGWETTLKKVIFTNFRPSKFNFFLESLMVNAKTVDQIAFTDYKNSHKVPSLNLEKVEESRIENFWFHKCQFNIIGNFLSSCQNYTGRISELVLSSNNLKPSDLIKIFNGINNLESFNKLKNFSLMNCNMKPFPIEALYGFLKRGERLESLTLSNITADASLLFAAVCKSKTIASKIKMNKLLFTSAINTQKVEIPSNFVILDFSNSKFSTSVALKSMLEVLTANTPITSPFILNMNSLRLTPNIILEAFSQLKLSDVKGNICEFDWSKNILSAEAVKPFFDFLKTQRLRMLSLNNVNLQKQGVFFLNLTKFIEETKLPALDMSGSKLLAKFLTPFFEKIKSYRWMRRLCFDSLPNAGDEVCQKLAEIASDFHDLTEISCDNFCPTSKETFFKLWDAILCSKSIQSCRFPEVDFKDNLKLSSSDISSLQKEKLSRIKAKMTPSLPDQRADFILSQIRAQYDTLQSDSSLVGDDVFYGTLATPWVNPQNSYMQLEALESRQLSDDGNDEDKEKADRIQDEELSNIQPTNFDLPLPKYDDSENEKDMKEVDSIIIPTSHSPQDENENENESDTFRFDNENDTENDSAYNESEKANSRISGGGRSKALPHQSSSRSSANDFSRSNNNNNNNNSSNSSIEVKKKRCDSAKKPPLPSSKNSSSNSNGEKQRGKSPRRQLEDEKNGRKNDSMERLRLEKDKKHPSHSGSCPRFNLSSSDKKGEKKKSKNHGSRDNDRNVFEEDDFD